MKYDHHDIRPSTLTADDVIGMLRHVSQAPDSKQLRTIKNTFPVPDHPDERIRHGYRVGAAEDTVIAAPDGRVIWDVCRSDVYRLENGERVGGETPRCLPTMGRGGVQRWLKRRHIYAERCPCTSKDLVAIDALLQVGDKDAERLAVACSTGGGILEGMRLKRRRR